MNQKLAFQETVALAERVGMPLLSGSSWGLEHLRQMLWQVESVGFSDDKLGRWLGWAQCALVSSNCGVTLDDMRKLNASLF